MSMTKYGTYKVFKNTSTGKITKILCTDDKGLEKVSNYYNGEGDRWEELDYDPDVINDSDDLDKLEVVPIEL